MQNDREFQYINQFKFSQKSVLIKPIRLLEFSRAKFLLIESTGRKNDFAYRRCGEGKLYASNMLPRSKQKTSAIFLNMERCRRSKIWIGYNKADLSDGFLYSGTSVYLIRAR